MGSAKALRRYLKEKQPANGEAVLEMLYEYHNEQIKTDFNVLYQQMNGMPLKEVDKVIYAVCTLCRDHERAGFAEGVKIGIRLAEEIC